MGLSVQQLLLILAIIVLIFGAKKIPELAKGLGSGIKNFKKAVKDEDENAQGITQVATQKIESVQPQNGVATQNTAPVSSANAAGTHVAGTANMNATDVAQEATQDMSQQRQTGLTQAAQPQQPAQNSVS